MFNRHPLEASLHAVPAPWLERQRAQAYAEAERLRREALDDFWRGSNAVLATGITQARRTAERWAARLRRHRAAACEA
jgi:hypothetical protein